MADSRRWSSRSAASREDQFVRAPSFRDPHESEPLDGSAASWHGPESRRHMAMAAVLIVAAGAAAVGLMAFVDTGPSGSSLDPGVSAAESDDGPVDDVPEGDVPGDPASELGNITAPPLPTVPALP